MAIKKDIFSAEENKMADFMKAMAHPARVAIMIKLAQSNHCIEGEIVQDIPLSNNIVALHIKALERAGLIKGTISNVRSCYCINWDSFWEFSDMFQTIFNDFAQKAQTQNCQKPKKTFFGWLPLLLPVVQIMTETDGLFFN